MDPGNLKLVPDELAKAVTRVLSPVLKPLGFRRFRKRDLVRIENGLAQSLYFQVSGWGGREFCVTASVNLIAANEHQVLQPGFRLSRSADGGTLWLPSLTVEEAERSAQVILASIEAQALPYFDRARTLDGFSALLGEEQWASAHHLSFQRGVLAAVQGRIASARLHLAQAIALYDEDGREWCSSYIERADQLLKALGEDDGAQLIATWHRSHLKAHGGT